MTVQGLAVDIPFDLDSFRPHAVHTDGGRIWPETNCYLDLWIEALHMLGHDPIPSLVCVLSADHDGQQWTFVKQEQSDLRILYGIEVAEETVWRSVLDTVCSGPQRGILHTVEVDSWWLPDTAGSDYRTAHTKTTIVPLGVDPAAREMTYLHNAGAHRLSGDDFTGIFELDTGGHTLPPYAEQIRCHPDRAQPDRVAELARAHLARRASGNPVERLAQSVTDAIEWLPGAGLEVFHRWAFATLRQCGASAELGSDLAVWLQDRGVDGAAAARTPLLEVASGAKAVQFKMARAARGRAVEVSDTLDAMSASWGQGLDALTTALG